MFFNIYNLLLSLSLNNNVCLQINVVMLFINKLVIPNSQGVFSKIEMENIQLAGIIHYLVSQIVTSVLKVSI